MKLISIIALFISLQVQAVEWKNGVVPPPVSLSGDEGAKLDGSPWSSTEIKDRVTLIFYVDPDVKDKNDAFGDALSAKKYSLEKIRYFGIINMASTWMPNFVLNEALKQKQKKYSDTVYVKDFTRKLVKEWNLPDNENNVLIFNQKGELLFHRFGEIQKDEIPELLALIEKNFTP